MGMFSGIEEAQVSKGGSYLHHGPQGFCDGVAKIIRCASGQTRKKVDFFVAELEILESTNPNQPKGFKCSYMITMDKDAALGNLKQFASVAGETEENEVDEAGVEAICSADNPLEGVLIGFHAFNKPTQAGNDFTRVVWSTYTAPKEAPKA